MANRLRVAPLYLFIYGVSSLPPQRLIIKTFMRKKSTQKKMRERERKTTNIKLSNYAIIICHFFSSSSSSSLFLFLGKEMWKIHQLTEGHVCLHKLAVYPAGVCVCVCVCQCVCIYAADTICILTLMVNVVHFSAARWQHCTTPLPPHTAANTFPSTGPSSFFCLTISPAFFNQKIRKWCLSVRLCHPLDNLLFFKSGFMKWLIIFKK